MRRERGALGKSSLSTPLGGVNKGKEGNRGKGYIIFENVEGNETAMKEQRKSRAEEEKG